MADIRMQEAWAMANWLRKANSNYYALADNEAERYDILIWNNTALTRVDAGTVVPSSAKCLYSAVEHDHSLAFIAKNHDDRKKIFGYPITFIPFSTYDLGDKPTVCAHGEVFAAKSQVG